MKKLIPILMLSLLLTTGCVGGGKALVLKQQLMEDAAADLKSTSSDVERLGKQFIEFKSKLALKQLDQHFANLIKLGNDTGNLTPDKVAQITEQYWKERKAVEDKVKADLVELQVLVSKIDSSKQAVNTLSQMEDYEKKTEEEITTDITNIQPLLLEILGKNVDPSISDEVKKIWIPTPTESEIPEGGN